MQRRSAKFGEALARIREVVVAQQTALAQQAQARQHYDANEYEHGDPNGISEDMKSQGFAGGDSKKRRGVSPTFGQKWSNQKLTRTQRAAPPGRCHSCNRAETPEWRRGPDGARTLCNACGLRKFSSNFELMHRSR